MTEDRIGLTHEYLIPVLVNAVKELDAEVTALRARLETLEGQ